MEKDILQLKVGDYVIENYDKDTNYNIETINSLILLKVFQIIALTPQPKLVVGRHLNSTTYIVTDRCRLANEKEIKEYKLKSVFNKEVKK